MREFIVKSKILLQCLTKTDLIHNFQGVHFVVLHSQFEYW